MVDNYSDDARRYTNKSIAQGPERSPQVNYGVKMASGKYIYEIGSDFVLESSLIEEAVHAAESRNYAAILIHTKLVACEDYDLHNRLLSRIFIGHPSLTLGFIIYQPVRYGAGLCEDFGKQN